MPLTGVRVIDLTRILAGPFCSMVLGDTGAEVIKVETPGEGDPVRRQGVIRDGLSWYFAGFNRDKRSVILNLRDEEGREVLAKLIAGCDVLVENFRPGVLVRVGFDGLNPDLVCCHITGFGDSGPYRDRPSFDFYRSGDERLHGDVEMLYFPINSPKRHATSAAPPPTLADTDVILGELG